MTIKAEKQNQSFLSPLQVEFLSFLHSRDTASQITRVSRSAALIHMRAHTRATNKEFNQLWSSASAAGWLEQHLSGDEEYSYSATDVARDAFAEWAHADQPEPLFVVVDDAPSVPQGLDAMIIDIDSVLIAGKLEQLARLFESQEGNEFTVLILRRAAGICAGAL